MSRNRMTRMDVDTSWLHHHDFRYLRTLREADWPTFACIYFALLADCWKAEDRLALDQRTWHAGTFPTDLATARRVLKDAGLLDKTYRVPEDSWEDWYGPARARLAHLRGLNESRWSSSGGPSGPHRGVHGMVGTVGNTNNSTGKEPRPADSAARGRGGGPRSLKQLMKEAGYSANDDGA